MPRRSELLLEDTQAVNSPVRRSSRLSQTKEAAPAEQPPAATVKNRRWSASDQETAQTKSLRGGRGSQDVEETKTPIKATRGRRSSITSETVDDEKSQESKPDTKKPTRKSLLSDNSETKVTPRITRRRSASVDEGLINENGPLTRRRRQSLEPLEVDLEAKRITRTRSSSIEKLEEPEIVHTPKKATVTKTKRRGSVTLDPIEEQTEIRKSVSPTQDAKDLSIILETSFKEDVNRSGTSSPEKMQARSSKSPVLNDETEKRKSFSPRRSARRSSSRSPVVNETRTPKTRRSLLENYQNSDRKSKEKQNRDEHISDEADKIDHQSETLIPNGNIAETNISHSKYQKLDHENEENRDQVDLEKEQIGGVEINKNTLNEQKPQEIVQEKQLNGKTVAGEEASISHSSSKSQQNDTENIEMEDTNIQSQEEEKENVLAKSNPENLVDSVSSTDKISKLKEDSIEVPLQEVQVRNARVSLGGTHRVSNVFRPKDVDFSFAEPMEVDELSMLNDTRKTNIDISRIDESVDDSFKLTLSETELIGKDDIVLAGSKTETDGVVPTKERELNVGGEAENETTPKIRLREEQKELLNGTNADDVRECKETCESDDYEFEIPSDDDTESNKLKTENTPRQEEEEEDVNDISEQKQPEEDKEASCVKVNSDFSETDKKSETKDVDADKESKTDPQLLQNQAGKREPIEDDAEKDVEADKESETGAQPHQNQAGKREANEDDAEKDVGADKESETGAQPHQNQAEKREANANDTEKDVEADKESETDAQLHQDQAEKVDANHSEIKVDENDAGKDVEVDNYHDKTRVIDDINVEVECQGSQMDQTLQFPQGESKNHINGKGNPSEVVDLEDTLVDDKRAENCRIDTFQAKSHKTNESPKKSEGHGSLIVNNVIDATDNSSVTLDLKNHTVEDTKLTNPTSTNDQVSDTCIDLREKPVVDNSDKLTHESPITEHPRASKKGASNNSSLSENESDWTTESSKSNDSNSKEEAVEVNSSTRSDVAGNTPERRRSKGTRKLLKTVERNSTRKLNCDDSVMVVEHSECELSISNKINKYLDSKIADIRQSNSSTNDDSVFLDNKDEVMEENIFVNSSSAEGGTDTSLADSNAIKESEKSVSLDDVDSEEEESDEENEFVNTMAEEGEEDTPSEDSNAIVDEGESVGSSDSEKQETDEYDSDDSFICNEEDEELLPGHEFDLEVSGENKGNKRKSRIINIDNEDTDVIIVPKKEKPVKPRNDESFIRNEENEDLHGYEFDFEGGGTNKENKRKSRIIDVDNEDTDVIIIPKKEKSVKPRKASSRITLHDSSSEEDKSDAEDAIVPQDKKDENTKPTIHSKPEVSARRSSITILENVNVKDIKDPCMSERIHSLMESFTTHIKEGDISMNLSLEYTNDNVLGKKVKKRKSDSSEAGEADAKKTKFEEPVVNLPKQDNSPVVPARKIKKKRKTSSNQDLKTQTFSLMNQLITDVKNRPKRSIKPSLTMDSSWAVEKIKAKPSISMISKKEKDEFQANKVHPKDLRQKLLYNSGRVKRVDTKTLLKKRGGI